LYLFIIILNILMLLLIIIIIILMYLTNSIWITNLITIVVFTLPFLNVMIKTENKVF